MNNRKFWIVSALGLLLATFLIVSEVLSFRPDFTWAFVLTPWIQLCIIVVGLGTIIQLLIEGFGTILYELEKNRK